MAHIASFATNSVLIWCFCFHDQLSSNSKGCLFGLHELKEIISYAACYLRENHHSAVDSSDQDNTETTPLQHAAIAHGVVQMYKSRVLPVDSNKLQDLVESHFPSPHNTFRQSVSPSKQEDTTAVLVEAVHSELSDRHLQCLPSLVEKVCIWQALSSIESTDVSTCCSVEWYSPWYTIASCFWVLSASRLGYCKLVV